MFKEQLSAQPDKENKIFPMFKHALVSELKQIIAKTEGKQDREFYQSFLEKIQEPNGIEDLLEGGDFSMQDILDEYEKKYPNGDKMPVSENLADIIQYLKSRFSDYSHDGNGNREPGEDNESVAI